MKIAALILLLGACLWSPLAAAQPADVCAACVAAGGCDSANETCVAQCRAQFFEIDPRRSQCLSQCSAAVAQCARVAEASCRSQKVCR